MWGMRINPVIHFLQKTIIEHLLFARESINPAILRDTGHTKGRLHTGGIGQGKETKNWNVV
jgi:hypothetical protein